MKGNWLLPEGLADSLPAQARRTEELRRSLLDLYRRYGFELVAPPLAEYIDSLLSATGGDLDLQTCKLVDQLSGRTLGVRADMTPQVSRIDAHILNRPGVTRLCYCGTTLHARPAGLNASRELLQIGAEVYGHAGFEADLEVIGLALETVRLAGVPAPRLDICHPGLARALIDADAAAGALADDIYALLREKDQAGLDALAGQGLRAETLTALRSLVKLYGGVDTLARARRELPLLPDVVAALEALDALCSALPDMTISLDLADVGSYGYHSGVTFSVYAEGWHEALVRGGRYDNVSRAFGRARPATGFSLDLRRLVSGLAAAEPARAIKAPWGREPTLLEAVRALRDAGEIVIQVLPGETPGQDEFIFDRELAQQGAGWVVKTVCRFQV